MTEQTNEPKLSFSEADYASDIAALAASMGDKTVVEATPTVTPAQPTAEPVVAAVTPSPANVAEVKEEVVVPDKFKAPDGTIDADKLAKSSVNVEQALAKYLEKEKELKRKINEVKAAENGYITPTNTPTPIPTQANPNIPFRQQLAQDIQAQGIEVVLEKLFTASQEAALEQARKELTPLKQGFEQATTRQQVEAIGKSDPWVYTEEGVNTLNTILAEQPYLMQAADPYKAAYIVHMGLNGVNARTNSQVTIPTPTAKASVPVPTAQAANSVPITPTVRLDSNADINAHLKTLNAKQQDEFFQKLGFPAFNARR